MSSFLQIITINLLLPSPSQRARCTLIGIRRHVIPGWTWTATPRPWRPLPQTPRVTGSSKRATAEGVARRCLSVPTAATNGAKVPGRRPVPLAWRLKEMVAKEMVVKEMVAKEMVDKEILAKDPHNKLAKPLAKRLLWNGLRLQRLPFASSTRILAPPLPQCRQSPNQSLPIFPSGRRSSGQSQTSSNMNP